MASLRLTALKNTELCSFLVADCRGFDGLWTGMATINLPRITSYVHDMLDEAS